MPKTLNLFRHAEAVAKESRQDDKTRDLTQTGIKDSLHIGNWFLEQNIHFDLIVTSSALRAERTTEMAVQGMKSGNTKILSEDALYEASVRQLLEYINHLEDTYHNVLCVGHNPAISYLAEYLTKADIGDMATGSVAIIRFDLSSWKEVSENTGVLLNYVSPGTLTGDR